MCYKFSVSNNFKGRSLIMKVISFITVDQCQCLVKLISGFQMVYCTHEAVSLYFLISKKILPFALGGKGYLPGQFYFVCIGKAALFNIKCYFTEPYN